MNVNITRGMLKYNFLKEIVLRLDFQRVFDSELEPIIIKTKAFLSQAGFNRFEEKDLNEVNFELNIKENRVMTNNDPSVNKSKVYLFIDETKGYTIELSNSSMSINVKSKVYRNFDEYGKYFEELIKLLNSESNIFTAKRIGLRKKNICFLSEKDKIMEYFSDYYFRDSELLKDKTKLMSEKTQLFLINDFFARISCAENNGIINNKEVYQIIIDIDFYLNQQEKLEQLLPDQVHEKLIEMNNNIFKFYMDTLSDKFKQLLISNDEEDFESCGIIGVEKNEYQGV